MNRRVEMENPWIENGCFHSLTTCHLPDDWKARYNVRPVLIDTFVQKDRFLGTFYRAAKWILCGQTKECRKLGFAGKISAPSKMCGYILWIKKFKDLLKKLLNHYSEYLLSNNLKSTLIGGKRLL